MKRLEDLPLVASRQLGGLNATSSILAKAKLSAAEYKNPRTAASRAWQPVLAVCMALALCVGATLWVTDSEDSPLRPKPTENVLDSYSAGDTPAVTTAPRHTADIPRGSISMRSGGQNGGETLFASGQGSSFPLLTMRGATYRMLTSPDSVSSSLVGDALDSVAEFNVEPALGTSGIVSNVVNRGETVYAVSGLKGTFVAAQVDGTMRLFQRVSYAGTAIIGNETLEDTLCSPSDVQWMEMSGVGSVRDVEDAQLLMQTLLDCSDYQSTSMTGSGSLRIGLSNGLTLQLLVGDGTVSACGTWSAPDFFDAFYEAAVR